MSATLAEVAASNNGTAADAHPAIILTLKLKACDADAGPLIALGYFKAMEKVTVEDTFFLKGRGVVAAVEVSSREHDFKIGRSVEIIRPDGVRVVSVIYGVDTFTNCFTERIRIGILLDETISKEDVPRGSVIALRLV